jgi:hypothetical protein
VKILDIERHLVRTWQARLRKAWKEVLMKISKPQQAEVWISRPELNITATF